MQVALQRGLANSGFGVLGSSHGQLNPGSSYGQPPLRIEYTAAASTAGQKFAALCDKPVAATLPMPSEAIAAPPPLALEDAPPLLATKDPNPSTQLALPLLSSAPEQADDRTENQQKPPPPTVSPAVAQLAAKIEMARESVKALGHIARVAVTTASLSMRVPTPAFLYLSCFDVPLSQASRMSKKPAAASAKAGAKAATKKAGLAAKPTVTFLSSLASLVHCLVSVCGNYRT